MRKIRTSSVACMRSACFPSALASNMLTHFVPWVKLCGAASAIRPPPPARLYWEASHAGYIWLLHASCHLWSRPEFTRQRFEQRHTFPSATQNAAAASLIDRSGRLKWRCVKRRPPD